MEIEDYLKAGTPLLFLPTTEYPLAENKIFDAFRRIVNEEVTIGRWRVSAGTETALMLPSAGSKLPPFKNEAGREQLVDALYMIQSSKDPMLVVFHNLHFYMDEAVTIQSLIDATLKAKTVGSHIVLIGPPFACPPELKSLLVQIPFALPTQNEIEKLYERMANECASILRMPDGKKWFKSSGKVESGHKTEDRTYRAEEKANLITSAARSACGMDLFTAETALSLSIAQTKTIDPVVVGQYKRREVSKSQVLEFIPREEVMENIGGFGALKKWLKLREKAFSQKARDYGLSYPKGLLFVGVQGSGKSLAAKAVGTFLGIDTLRLKGAEIFRKYVGESEQLFAEALSIAEAIAPVNLWIDEIEKFLKGHNTDVGSSTSSHLMQHLLTWQQEHKAPVMIVATANSIDNLPPELTRKGRFDEIWTTGMPTTIEREEIFTIHLKKRKRNPDNFDVQALALKSRGFVGAEIESAIEDAMYIAFFEDREFETSDILKSMKATAPQSKIHAEQIAAITQWAGSRARSVSDSDESQTITESSKVRRLQKGND